MKKSLLNLKIAVMLTGLFLCSVSANAITAVTSGNWSSSTTWGGTPPTGTVTGQDITIPPGVTVTLDANVTFSGLVNNFVVNGALVSTSNNWITMTGGTFSGNGSVSINRINFTLLSSSTYSGSLSLKTFMNNASSSLGLIGSVNVSDTLDLDDGNVLLGTNGSLTMMTNSTIKVRNGGLTLGSGSFNSSNAYNVMYTGTTKTAGLELNSSNIQNLTLNLNSVNEMVNMNSNVTVNGNLNLNSGRLVFNSRKLTIKGNVSTNANGTFATGNTSDLSIEGTGAITGSLMFEPNASINNFTINRSGSTVKLASGLNLNGQLQLMDGNLSVENGGTLTANNSSTIHIEKGALSLNSGTFVGTASYNVEYTGSNDASSGAELYGSGLNNVMLGMGSNNNKLTLTTNTGIQGQLKMATGRIDLNGKVLALNGTMAQTTNSGATFIGSSTSELHLNLTAVNNNTIYFDNANASNQTLNRLRINNTGSSYVMLGSMLNISNELSFIKGKLELGNSNLIIMQTGNITGYDDTKYIVTSANTTGALVMNVTAGSAYVTFPIGLSSEFSPAYVQQASSATTGTFSARTTALYTSSLKAVNRTWFMESGMTNLNTNLKFGWTAAAEMNSFNRTTAYVSHYTNGSWDLTSASSATLAANNTYELSRTGLTSLSPFAVVEQGQPLKVGEQSKLANIELYPNPSHDVVTVKNAGSDNFKYELTDLTGRTINVSYSSANVNKFDISNLGTGCYFIKITNLSDNNSTVKRFVKE